jgi:hypothetical protein
MRVPVVDVIVVGAMKSGTTSIYHLFKQNNIFGVHKKKEVNFFLREFDAHDLALYDSTFHRGNIRVDVSPNYSKRHLYSGNTAKEIGRSNPDARIIYLVRDPLTRIESHLYHNLLRDRVDLSKLTDMKYLENYIRTSSYMYQIEPYLEVFKRGHVFALQQELMRSDPEEFVKLLSNFLNIPILPQKKIEVYYSGERRYLIPYYDKVLNFMGEAFVFKIYNPFWSLINIKPRPLVLPAVTRELIREKLHDDITRFCSSFTIDKSLWRDFFNSSEVKD